MKTLALVLLSFFSAQVWAQSVKSNSDVVTFTALEDLVKNKNEKVQAAESEALGAKARTGFTSRSFLPGFSLRGGSESAKFGSSDVEQRGFWTAEAKLNLYRGGRDKLEGEIREAQFKSAQIGAQKQMQSELRDARKLYWQLVSAQNLISDIEDAIKGNTENLQSSRRRVGAGVTTNADVLQFELENTALNQQLKKLKLEADFLKNKLGVIIGFDQHKDLNVESTFPHPPDESLPKDSAEGGSRNLYVADFQINETIQNLRKSQAARWWLPSLDVYTSFGRPSLSYNDFRALDRQDQWIAGVQLSISLDQALEDMASSRAQKFEAKSASLQKIYASKQSNATYHEYVHDLNLLHELLHDAQKDVEKANNFLKATKQDYVRGVKNGPDLLGAFARYYEFRTRKNDLYRAFHETKADFDFHLASTQ